MLRMVLSYSREAYSEAVTSQDTETFLRCLENGLRSLCGSLLILNLDNMKTAVLKADWFDPQINPSWPISTGTTACTWCRVAPPCRNTKESA
jgi:transposase